MKYIRSYKHRYKKELMLKYNGTRFAKTIMNQVREFMSGLPLSLRSQAFEFNPSLMIPPSKYQPQDDDTFRVDLPACIDSRMIHLDLAQGKDKTCISFGKVMRPVFGSFKPQIQRHDIVWKESPDDEFGYVEGTKLILNEPPTPGDKIIIKYVKTEE